MNSVKTVGRYELLDPIGYGGMAVVYLARQTDLDRLVALKELRMFAAPDEPGLAERFLREAHMAGKMSHPNIVTVHEYFESEGTPYIAMEYLQRGSLRPWVDRMTVAQIAGVLEGVLAALDHAERYGIVHRDLKPENLLVTDQGQIKVADFGIAKPPPTNTSPLLTATGTTVGTPTYMAPEQAMGHILGPYTDLYSVGVMAYEFLVGRAPFDDTDTPVAIILRHLNEEIPSAHTVNPKVDRALSDWIDRLLIKDPAQRTQTAEQAWDALEEVVLQLLGSRWRREARLAPTAEQPVAAPLTPAPFTSTDVETPVPQTTSGEFQSFAWGARAAPPAEPPPAADAPAPVAPVAPAAPAVMTPPSQPTPPQRVSEPVQPAARAEPSQPSVAAPESTFKTFMPATPHFGQRDDQAVPPPAPASPPTPLPTPTPAEPVSPAAAPWSVAPQAHVEAPTVRPDAVPLPLQPPPQPRPSPDVHRRRQAVLIGGGATAVVVAVAAVVLLAGGGSGSSTGAPAPGSVALDNSDLALAVPASWSRHTVPAIPGLHRRNAVAAARGSDRFVAAELVRGNADPSLLPSTLLAAQRGRPEPKTITLAGQPAYRYDELRGSGQPLRVYAVLTTEGIATIACGTSASAAAGAARDCDEIAGTLKLKSTEALPAGPSKSYGATLKKGFARLDGRVKAAKAGLAKAGSVAAQAAQVQRLADGYDTAITPGDPRLNAVDARLNTKLASLFRDVADAYGRLESAVQRSDAAAQARAQQALKRLRARMNAAGAALARAGYPDKPPRLLVPAISPPRLPGAATPPPSAQPHVTPPSNTAPPQSKPRPSPHQQPPRQRERDPTVTGTIG